MNKTFITYTCKFMMLLLVFGLIIISDSSVRANDAITVDEVIAKNNHGDEVTVEGYIVGYVKSEQSVIKEDFQGDTNVAIAANRDETDTSKMLYIQLPKEFRTDFGLNSNPDMLEKPIKVTGNLETYFRTDGLKEISHVIEAEENSGHKSTETKHGKYEEENVQIHDIQGKGHESPLKGQDVKDVEGIVTYKYDIQGTNYFHIQSPEDNYDGDPKTSEGIVIYTGKEEDVAIGDLVHVSGTVVEYYIDGNDDKAETDLPVTEINASEDRSGCIHILERNVALPEPVKLSSSDIPGEVIGENGFEEFDPERYAIDFWESMEGMRVEIEASKAVAPQEEGSLVLVSDEFETDTENGGVRLTEEGPSTQLLHLKMFSRDNGEEHAVKTGDQFTKPITGVVNYGFSNYKIYTDLEEVADAFTEGHTKSETTDIVKDEQKLTVASYNVENFSANDKEDETPDEKAKNIARAFVKDMNNPDIVGVIEMQDNNGEEQGPFDADASKSYKRLIHNIKEADGPEYDYVNIDPRYNEDGGVSDGNIRVGFLYNAERVSLTDEKEGTADEAVAYADGNLTVNPGRVAPQDNAFKGIRKPLAAQFEFQGESFVVVANHLNAKLGDDPLFGQNQPPVLESENRRIEMAQILNEFVQDIQTNNPDENIVVLGDMNDDEYSDAVRTVQGKELTNLIEKVPEEDRYSFLHQGNSQVIDHMFVSNHLAEGAEIDILHVNADFTEVHERASDHDPVLVQLDLDADEETSTTISPPLIYVNIFLPLGAFLVTASGVLLLIRKRYLKN